MQYVLTPTKLTGNLSAIASKSQAHRLLICAALADGPTELYCAQTNQDIQATVACLQALGAHIQATSTGYRIFPIQTPPKQAVLPCRESGSTLRFLLPLAAALGVDAQFLLDGRLPQRPLHPLWEEMAARGCQLSRPGPNTLHCTGRLPAGDYSIDGSVSSQFITGLLFALSQAQGESRLTLTGKVESAPYIEMTLQALALFGLPVAREGSVFQIRPKPLHTPGAVHIEGDWSNGAFWLAANALGSHITLTGLEPQSPQGDRAVVSCLEQLNRNAVIDASQIPDLVPILAVVAGAKQGARFIHAERLRLKETDRLETTRALLQGIGGCAEIQGDALIVHPTGYTGGTVDATGDHRIAMAAAIAATVCTAPVTIRGAESVQKSYPAFWQDYQALGGLL